MPRNFAPQLATRNFLPAFTLIEVMFAVILLGIGFIMVAAMFPVAIGQSRTSTEETAASAMARAAMAHLSEIADGQTMPNSSNKVSMNPPHLWQAIRGAAIDQSDPRYAWTGLYRRAANSDTAQVYIFALQVRNHSAFNLNDTEKKVRTGTPDVVYEASIEPKRIRIVIPSTAPLNRIVVLDSVGDPMPAAAEGAYILDADTATLLRLGNAIDAASGQWELATGNPPASWPGNVQREAFMVGRGYGNDVPQTSANPPTFEGPAMDIAVFTGFVRVK